jgi:hypothetical protein
MIDVFLSESYESRSMIDVSLRQPWVCCIVRTMSELDIVQFNKTDHFRCSITNN